jgi:hypothetical protein
MLCHLLALGADRWRWQRLTWIPTLLVVATFARPAVGQSYSFKQLMALGDPIPGTGRKFAVDFEIYAVNNAGDLIGGADMDDGNEMIFFRDAATGGRI